MDPTDSAAPVHPSSASRILATALDLFAVRGYDATSVREICQAAGITKPSLYHFFGSKEGVLRALATTSFEQFRTIVDSALATPGPLRTRLKTITRAVFEDVHRQPRLWRFLHGMVWAMPGTTELPHCMEVYDEIVGVLARAVDEAVQTREIAPGPTEIRMLILAGAIEEAAHGYLIAGRPELTPELADLLVDTVLDGWQ